MKKNWIKTLAVGAVIMAGVTTANAHSLSRGFNIRPFSAPLTSTYNKTDSTSTVGVSLSQAGVEERRDIINFVIAANGGTFYNYNIAEGASSLINYSISPGSTVSFTYRDAQYNLGAHTVNGTLYW